MGRPQPAMLVTGASRGIGRAIALNHAQAGQAIIVNYLKNQAAALEVCAAIEAVGGTALAIQADLSSHEAVRALFGLIRSNGYWVRTLINNAGITRDGLLAGMPVEDWQAVMKSNVDSVYYCIREALSTMIAKKQGTIVTLASVSGLRGHAGQSNYSAAKGALIAMTRSLAREVGRSGIRVNTVAPGFIETDMLEALRETPRGRAQLEDAVEHLIPLKRLGTAEDVAAAVQFLCSPLAKYITGHTLVVDGGLSV